MSAGFSLLQGGGGEGSPPQPNICLALSHQEKFPPVYSQHQIFIAPSNVNPPTK